MPEKMPEAKKPSGKPKISIIVSSLECRPKHQIGTLDQPDQVAAKIRQLGGRIVSKFKPWVHWSP
jgi:hypothetical protein